MGESEVYQSEFNLLAAVARELKAPLVYQQTAAEYLRDHKVSRDVRDEYLKRISLSSERLLQLIDNLLLSQRVLYGQVAMQFEPVNLTVLIKDVLKEVEPRAVRLQHGIVPTSGLKGRDALVVADRTILRSTFTTLVDLSTLTSLPETELHVHMRRESGVARVVLEDDGIVPGKRELTRAIQTLGTREQAFRSFAGVHGVGVRILQDLLKGLGGQFVIKRARGRRVWELRLPLSTQLSMFGDV